jgi:hypothetical protein
MRTVLAGVLLSMLAAAGCAQSEGESQAAVGFDLGRIDKIAIVEITGVRSQAVKSQISDYFMMEMMRKGYTFVERQRINMLVKEQQFQASDLTTQQGAARAGQILNVPAVMVINIPKYSGGKMEMTAKLIDVESATVLWMGRGTGKTNQDLSTFLGVAAGAAVGAAVGGHDITDRAIGGVIGGAAGGVAGYILSPEEEEIVKQVVAKVVEKLPDRTPELAK